LYAAGKRLGVILVEVSALPQCGFILNRFQQAKITVRSVLPSAFDTSIQFRNFFNFHIFLMHPGKDRLHGYSLENIPQIERTELLVLVGYRGVAIMCCLLLIVRLQAYSTIASFCLTYTRHFAASFILVSFGFLTAREQMYSQSSIHIEDSIGAGKVHYH